eukprot:4572818-Lingulodinium_polyedra.AAC.1
MTEVLPAGVRAMPPWAAMVLRNRPLFEHTVFRLQEEAGGVTHHLLFNWASQNPFVLCTQSIRLLDP